MAPIVVAAFPDELVTTLTALAVDSTASVAYVGSSSTGCLYAVKLTALGQSLHAFDAFCVNSDVTAMALSPDGTRLYYTSPEPGTLYAVPVQEGGFDQQLTPAILYSSSALIYPDSLLVDGSTFYVKDGGILQGRGNPFVDAPETLYSLSLPTSSAGGANLTALYRSTTISLPPGLLLVADHSRLYFTTGTALTYLPLTHSPGAMFSSSSSSVTSVLSSTPASVSSSSSSSALASSSRLTSLPLSSSVAQSPGATSTAATGSSSARCPVIVSRFLHH